MSTQEILERLQTNDLENTLASALDNGFGSTYDGQLACGGFDELPELPIVAHDGWLTISFEGDSETFTIADYDHDALAKAVINAAVELVQAMLA